MNDKITFKGQRARKGRDMTFLLFWPLMITFLKNLWTTAEI